MNQKDQDNVYLDIAESLSRLSKCRSLQVGAVVVREGRILSTGINGTPKGSKNHCEDLFPHIGDWLEIHSENHHQWSLRNEIHAEMNAIIFAARNGIAIEGARIYVTHQPCQDCTKNLAAAGIKDVRYRYSYSRVESDDYVKQFILDNNMKIVRTEK